MRTYYTYFESPIDTLMLTSDGTALTGLFMIEHKSGPQVDSQWVEDDAAEPFKSAKEQLSAYFAGNLQRFDIPLRAVGTPFQKQVWKELAQIPYAETISYGELAARIGNPKASRAVGLANGSNPIAIIVPCHRVIGSNGKLTGFGGGLHRKEKLLNLEKGAERLSLFDGRF